MADFEIKAHDLLPVLRVNLTRGAFNLDVSAATGITFIMSNKATATIVVNGSVTIEDPVNGLIRYDWVTGDTATPGDYLGEFQITWPGPKHETFPTDSYMTIEIFRDLDNA
jgi:hypothetical protein